MSTLNSFRLCAFLRRPAASTNERLTPTQSVTQKVADVFMRRLRLTSVSTFYLV